MQRNRGIEINGLYLNVKFDYQEKEKATVDYPGSNDEIEIQEVILHSNDVTDIFEAFDLFEQLEEKLRKND